MREILKGLYGAGILFFYYTKWLILIGLPILYFGLDYHSNVSMNVLWFYSLALAIKDFLQRFWLK